MIATSASDAQRSAESAHLREPAEGSNRLMGVLCGILLLSTLFVPWHFQFARAGEENMAIVWPWDLLKTGTSMAVQVYLYAAWILGGAAFLLSLIFTRFRLAVGYLVLACIATIVLALTYGVVSKFGVPVWNTSPLHTTILILPILSIPLLILQTMAHRIAVSFRLRAVIVLVAALLGMLVLVTQMIRISRLPLDWESATSLGIANQIKYALAYVGALMLLTGAIISIYEAITRRLRSVTTVLGFVYPGLVLAMLQLRPLSTYNLSGVPKAMISISFLLLLVEAVAGFCSELVLRRTKEKGPQEKHDFVAAG